MKVIILKACDGFTIVLDHGNEEAEEHHWFNQEDDLTGLVEVFNKLGYEAEYEEDY